MSGIEFEKRRINLVKDYQEIFKSDSGQRVLFDLMKKGHMIHHTENKFEEGERRMVIYILKQLNVDVVKMMKYIEDAKKRGES